MDGRSRHATRHRIRPLPVAVLWCAVVLLAAIGAGAAVGRSVFRSDLAARVDPFRQQVLRSFHREDPFAQRRAAELRQFDGRFGSHPLLTLLHILPGGVFLVLAPFQFSSRIRNRHIRFHRWSGRVLVLTAFVSGLTALYFGLVLPFGGRSETLPIAVFGCLFLVAISRAFIAIRRHQVSRHREWMIRAFAIAIAISTVRIVGAVLDLALTPAGVPAVEIFVISLWTGWIVTLGAAELWIRYTRPHTGLIVASAASPDVQPVV